MGIFSSTPACCVVATDANGNPNHFQISTVIQQHGFDNRTYILVVSSDPMSTEMLRQKEVPDRDKPGMVFNVNKTAAATTTTTYSLPRSAIALQYTLKLSHATVSTLSTRGSPVHIPLGTFFFAHLHGERHNICVSSGTLASRALSRAITCDCQNT